MNKELCIHGVDLDVACNECSPPFVNVDYYITPRKDKPLTADEIVSVQPMPAPSGFVFYYEENEE